MRAGLLFVFLLLSMGYIGTLSLAGNTGYLYVVDNSCGYQLASDLASMNSVLRGQVVSIEDLDIGSINRNIIIVIFLFNNTNNTQFILDNLLSLDNPLIITDNLGNRYTDSADAIIPLSLVRRACIQNDEEALREIESIILSVRVASNTPNPALVAAVIAVATVASLYNELRNNRIARKAGKALVLPLLRYRMRCGPNVLNHELRLSIYNYIEERGAATYKEIMGDLNIPRGNFEWHISILERCGYIETVKIGKRRFFVPSKPGCRTLERLRSMAKNIDCIITIIKNNNNSVSPEVLEQIRSKCRMRSDINKVVSIIIKSIVLCESKNNS